MNACLMSLNNTLVIDKGSEKINPVVTSSISVCLPLCSHQKLILADQDQLWATIKMKPEPPWVKSIGSKL